MGVVMQAGGMARVCVVWINDRNPTVVLETQEGLRLIEMLMISSGEKLHQVFIPTCIVQAYSILWVVFSGMRALMDLSI